MRKFWKSLSSKFGRENARTHVAQLALTRAYKRVFDASSEDAQLVLADLANASSRYKVCPPTVSDDELRYIEGARSLYSRVLAFTDFPREALAALEDAARREAVADEPYTQTRI